VVSQRYRQYARYEHEIVTASGYKRNSAFEEFGTSFLDEGRHLDLVPLGRFYHETICATKLEVGEVRLVPTGGKNIMHRGQEVLAL
jgi:hypothetical protein